MSEQSVADRYRRPVTVLALGAAMLVSTPGPAVANEHVRHYQEGYLVERNGQWRPLPLDLKALIKEVSKDHKSSADVLNLLQQPYKELLSFPLGESNVRILQVGGELANGPLSGEKLSVMKYLFDYYNQFAALRPRFKVPLTEVSIDIDDKSYINHTKVNVELNPISLKRDRVVFVVPARVNIGFNRDRGPAEFTDRKSSKIVTFLRPDFADAQGVWIEPCQSVAKVMLSKNNPADLIEDKKILDSILQELICNGLGQAVFRSLSGQPYQEYADIFKQPIVITTAAPRPGIDGFAGVLPYVNNEAIYAELGRSSVPANIK